MDNARHSIAPERHSWPHSRPSRVPARSVRAAQAALKLSGEETGRRFGGRGEPLVLLHPFALCAQVWKPVMAALKEQHEVFALSIPGHHGADPLPPNYEYSIAHAVDVLEQKLDSLGIQQAHLVGNSLGGWLALELARRGRALSVVALAPGGGWELGSREHIRLVRRFRMTHHLLRVSGPVATKLVRWALCRSYFLRDAVACPNRLSTEDAQLMIERVWRCEVYKDVVNAMMSQPAPEPFPELPCPVRLVWGAKDRLLPVNGYSERWRRILPGADWVVLPNVGHVMMYDDPDSVASAVLDFTGRDVEGEERLAS